MFLIRVVPLTRLPPNAPAVLDYFWPAELPAGCLVRAPLGRRTVTALVIGCDDVRTAKLALKRAGFELKKLSGVITAVPQLGPSQLRLAEWMSSQYACSLATAVKSVAPAGIGKPRLFIDHSSLPAAREPVPTTGTVLVTQPDTTRAALDEIIAASDGQIFILTPERAVAESLSATLPDGTICAHGGLTASAQRNSYRRVLDGSARVVVGTRSGLFLPWLRLTHIIVEDPLHEMYKSDMSPRYNAPDVARHLAALHGAALTWLTPAISTVQHHLMTTGKLTVELRKPHWPRVVLTSSQSETEAGHRSLFSREARDAILDAYDRGAPTLIVSSRRAYATIARCTSCRATLQCQTCDIPMRWHRTAEDMLVCYHCASARTVPRQCESCHNGLMRPAGIPGSQKLAEAVNGVLDRVGYATMKIPILDSDLVLNADDTRRVLAELNALKHPILVATSMADSLRYRRTFDTIIVPHVEMLASTPDYRSADRLILKLEKLADFKPSTMVLQTIEESGVTAYAKDRDWPAFFADELRHRKTLRWPPFSRIVKLSFSHRSRSVTTRAASAGADRLMRALQHIRVQGTQILGPSPALVEHGGGRWTHHIVIKSTLPSSGLAELLRYVPDGWTVDVDPRSIA